MLTSILTPPGACKPCAVTRGYEIVREFSQVLANFVEKQRCMAGCSVYLHCILIQLPEGKLDTCHGSIVS